MWKIRDRFLDPQDRCLVMGILNITPDSFSDGGQFFSPEKAIQHGVELARQGADILDLGAESTRPSAAPVPLDEECRRILPVVEGLIRSVDIPLSIDTYKPTVAQRCLEAGAHIINDVTAIGGNFDSSCDKVNESMLEVVREHQAGVILMHMQGTPTTMQQSPVYADAVEEILEFFRNRIEALTSQGIARENLAIDPGIGFGKTVDHNIALLRELSRFQALHQPVCLGVSRKSILGRILDKSTQKRVVGSLAVACHALAHSAVQILRVHEVESTCEAVQVFQRLR